MTILRPILVAILAASVAFIGFGCSAQSRKEKHLKNADEYFAKSDYEKAEIEYLNVLEIESLNAHAVSQLGLIYFDQGRMGRVMPFLLKGRELQPDNPDLRMKLARVTLATGNSEAARKEAQFVLEKRPNDPNAPLLIAETAVKPEEVAAARAALNGLPPNLRESAPVLVALGMLEFREGRQKEGVGLFERAIAKDPKTSAAHAALAGWYQIQGDMANAEQSFKLAAESSPIRSERRLVYARALGGSRNFTGARAELEKITSQAPDYLPAWIALGELAASEKKLDEAQSHVAKVLARDPMHPQALLQNARIYFAKEDRPKAIAEMEKLLREYPRSAQALFHMGMFQHASGDTNKAVANLSQAIGIAPGYAEAILALAEINLRRGEPRLATDALAPLVKQRPDLAQARMVLANGYQAQGRHNEALAIYADLAKSPDRALQATFMRATIMEQQNRRDDARATYDEVLKGNPDFLPAQERLIALDLADKKYDSAMARANAILSKNPKTAAPYLLQANVYLAQDQIDRAEEALLKAIEVEPAVQAAYFALARLYIANNRIDKALANFESVIAQNPTNTEVLMIIGTIHDQQKNFPKARETYEKLLAINPRFSPALNNLAYLYSEHFNQREKAHELAQRARDLLPHEPHIADTLGWILFQQGDYPRAASLLMESAANLQESAEIQYHLGMAQYMMGLTDPARQSLQRAVDLKVEFPGKGDAVVRLAVLAIDPSAPPASARSELEKRIVADAKDVGALTRLAAIHARAGETDKALELYQRVIRVSPNHVKASLGLVQMHVQRGDAKAALELARNVRKNAPDDPEAARILGSVAFRTGDHTWAHSLLQEAARRRSDDPALQFELAQAAYSVGRVDEADAALERIAQARGMSLNADDAKNFSELIALSRDPAKLKASGGTIDAALRADPKSVPALVARATLAEQAGDVASATKDYGQALSIYPEFTPTKMRLAILKAESGEVQSTYQMAIKARESFPNDPELEKAIGIILYRQKDFNRAASTLQPLVNARPNDGELNYYLGMAQAKLNRAAESKKNLEKALSQNLKAEHAAEAKQTLASLK